MILMSDLPVVLTDIPLALDKALFDKYESLDEKQDLYTDIKKTAAAASWMQADFFRYMWEMSPEKEIKNLSKALQESSSTINNYLRTAIAFPEEKRDAMATFSHHFQASFADSYNSKTKTFAGSTRFDWLEKAIDENWTTRRLNEEVMRTKQKQQLGVITPPCDICNKGLFDSSTEFVVSEEVIPYNFFNTKSKHTDHLNIHESCYQTVFGQYGNRK